MSRSDDGTPLALIREKGIYGLGYNEGCPCTEFNVRGVRVSVSCHKSSKTIHVYSVADENNLAPILEEVKRQVDAYYDADGEYVADFAVQIHGELS